MGWHDWGDHCQIPPSFPVSAWHVPSCFLSQWSKHTSLSGFPGSPRVFPLSFYFWSNAISLSSCLQGPDDRCGEAVVRATMSPEVKMSAVAIGRACRMKCSSNYPPPSLPPSILLYLRYRWSISNSVSSLTSIFRAISPFICLMASVISVCGKKK